MAAANRQLTEIIRREIALHGAMAFSDFMRLALYEPQHGYYASGRATIGRRGDFFTNVSVGALFGKLLAMQFAEMWERLGKPHEFSIVEQGANDGQFAHDILSTLKNSPHSSQREFFQSLRYVIVEPFAILRERQQQMLAPFSQVDWRDSLDALEPFCGVHFSNELIDALPVHLVMFANGEWREKKIVISETGEREFDWQLAEIENEKVREELAKIPLTAISEGYETEIRIAAKPWIHELSQKIERGYVLAIDYGFSREEFFSAERWRGTLACYANHRRSDDPLTAIGESDITAHVEFTSLIEAARAAGFDLAGFTDQHHFMVGLGTLAFPELARPLTAIEQKERRAFTTLMHPQMMGLSFKVLALAKSAPTQPLSGFAFSR